MLRFTVVLYLCDPTLLRGATLLVFIGLCVTERSELIRQLQANDIARGGGPRSVAVRRALALSYH